MRHLGEPLRRGFKLFRRDDPFRYLTMTEPLSYPMRTPARDVHVIVQKHDALTPVEHVEVIREAYPEVGWYVFEGTHLYPEGIEVFQRIIRRAVAGD
jgi:hypothetical protein